MPTLYSGELKFDSFSHFYLEREKKNIVRIDVESTDHSIYTSLKFSLDQASDIIKEIDLRSSDSEEMVEYEHIEHVELLEDEGKWILDIGLDSSWTSFRFNNKDDVRRLLSELRKASE